MTESYDVIIIGSGPAGLSAAIYAQRARLKSVVIEKNYISGGQVLNTYDVDNYPGLPNIGGFDLSQKLRQHAEGLGTEFKVDEVKSVELEGEHKKLITKKGEYEAKTVIVATGARHRKLGIKGEEELAGMGVSYCATCDGAFFKNKKAVVIGGGDVAVEDAIFLARMCEKVYLVHRREELRAAASLQEKLFSLSNVEVAWNHVPLEIQGEEKVEKLLIKNVKTQVESTLEVEGVFIAVGILPNSELFVSKLALDEQKYITAGEDCVTNVPGVFAAGDVRTKMLRQIVTAAADGANAVTSVERYLNTL